MKRTLLLLICTCLSVTTTFAQDDAAAQKAWTDYMTPGAMHKMMAMADGKWKTEMTFWMAPGSPSTTGSGMSTNRMVLGGRYQESKYEGTFAGMPFEGIGTLAFDNAKKVFQSTWMDNMGTGIMLMEGKWDDATRSITFTGKGVDPVTGKDMLMREVMKWVDDNTQIMEMYTMANGTEYKSMEIKFTRQL